MNNRIVCLGLLVGFLCLSACSNKPLSADQQQRIDVVSAVSFLGDEFVVDVINRSLLKKKELVTDVSAWQVDNNFRKLLQEGAEARQREFRALDLDAQALATALGQRENRWKKILGKHNHALMELLFTQAEKQGVHFFFLLAPVERHDNYPLHIGPMGIYCYDRTLRKSKAYPYFVFDFSLWDVAKRKKIFRSSVDPSATNALPFAECEAVAKLKDVVQEAEAPVKQAMRAVVDGLFQKMGWNKGDLL